MDQCREIAKQKMADLNAHDIEHAAQMIKGSASRWAFRWWRNNDGWQEI